MNTHTETKHTEGQWRVSGPNSGLQYNIQTNKAHIAMCSHIPVIGGDSEAAANARLIAAAPDLLRDLQSVLQRFDAELGILTDGRYSIKDFSECLDALKTIAKATEGAQ